MAYRIDVFDATDKRVAILQEEILTSLDLDIAEDSAPQITLSLPVSDEKAVWISPLYHIKVWNTEISEYEFSVFRLYNPEIEDGDNLSIKATYQGILTRLSGEYVEGYDTTDLGKPFGDVVADLLAYQINTPAITAGTIEPTQTVAIAVESSDIYAALNSIRKSYGGWFEVDSSYRLNWFEDSTGDPLRRIERRKNLKAISYTPQYDRVANRILAYGKGEGDARLNLTDAGEAQEYIEDVASQVKYGVIAKKYIDKTITHPSTLLKYAQRILDEFKEPPYQYSVDALNLAETDGYDYTFESLRLDTRVRVVDDLLGVDVNTSIVSMSINLLNPEEISIELSTIKNDLSDLFGDILSIQDVHNSVATQIGAGQVTVQGTFVVEDWVSAGTTTIDGGNITADTIEANTLTTSTMTSRTITLSGTDSVIRGNYSEGTSGWQIDGNGNAEFNDATIRGTLAACNVGTGEEITVEGSIKIGDNIELIGNNIYLSGPDPYIRFKSTPTAISSYLTIFKEGISLYDDLGNNLINVLREGEIYLKDSSGDTNIDIDKDGRIRCITLDNASSVSYITVTSNIDMGVYDLTCDNIYCDEIGLNGNTSNERIYSTGTHLYFRDSNGDSQLIV